jgi:hypothetical protein
MTTLPCVRIIGDDLGFAGLSVLWCDARLFGGIGGLEKMDFEPMATRDPKQPVPESQGNLVVDLRQPDRVRIFDHNAGEQLQLPAGHEDQLTRVDVSFPDQHADEWLGPIHAEGRVVLLVGPLNPADTTIGEFLYSTWVQLLPVAVYAFEQSVGFTPPKR